MRPTPSGGEAMTRRRVGVVEWPYWLVRSSDEEWITWDGKAGARSKVEDLRQSADDASEPKPWTEVVKMVPHEPKADAVVRAVVKWVECLKLSDADDIRHRGRVIDAVTALQSSRAKARGKK